VIAPKTIMSKIDRLCRQTETHLFLSCLFFLLICLPFFIYPEKDDLVNMFDKGLFFYFFIVWGCAILCLFFIQKCLADAGSVPSEKVRGEETDV